MINGTWEEIADRRVQHYDFSDLRGTLVSQPSDVWGTDPDFWTDATVSAFRRRSVIVIWDHLPPDAGTRFLRRDDLIFTSPLECLALAAEGDEGGLEQ